MATGFKRSPCEIEGQNASGTLETSGFFVGALGEAASTNPTQGGIEVYDCAHVYISGQVQGVFFRASAHEKANRLSLSGWVRNLPDGRVEGLFAGETRNIESMLEWCRSGPPGARVTKVGVSWVETPEDLTGFEIR